MPLLSLIFFIKAPFPTQLIKIAKTISAIKPNSIPDPEKFSNTKLFL